MPSSPWISERVDAIVRRTAAAAAIACALHAAVGSARADVLAGKVQTKVRDRATPATAVVYAEPLDEAAPSRPGAVTVAQKNKSFNPRVVGVPAGSTVTFPNEDAIFHNVFSLSPAQPFDLGLYRAGASKSRVFTQPATYNVFCNIHPQMVAFLVVAPTPWVTTTTADGTWRLDVPPGRYRVTAVSERAASASVEVRAAGGTVTAPDLALDESGFVPSLHTNKFGKEYPKTAYAPK